MILTYFLYTTSMSLDYSNNSISFAKAIAIIEYVVSTMKVLINFGLKGWYISATTNVHYKEHWEIHF